MNIGLIPELILLYVVMAGYAGLMLSIFIQMLFGAAIERERRRQFTERNGGAAYPLGPFNGKLGWANPRRPENSVQDGNSAGKLVGAARMIKQAIALVSIVFAFSLAGTVAAQTRTERQIDASTLRQQLLDLESRETELRMRLEEVDERLTPESIQRELAGIGSTHPEELREHQRRRLTIERNGIKRQLEMLAEQRARTEAAIAEAESTLDSPDAQPLPAPLPKRETDLSLSKSGAGNLLSKKSLVAMAMLAFVATGSILLLLVGFKRIRRRPFLLLIMLFMQLCVPGIARSQQSEPDRAGQRSGCTTVKS